MTIDKAKSVLNTKHTDSETLRQIGLSYLSMLSSSAPLKLKVAAKILSEI